jgi:thioredoxin-like negative regulator of GroEL
MVRQLSGGDYPNFVREKRAAAIHFDAEWDVGNRPVTRGKMQEAEEALGESINFGEIDCDRDIRLAKGVRLLGIPAVAYYLEGNLVALLLGIRQNIRGRLERMLRGELIGYKDGMDGGKS